MRTTLQIDDDIYAAMKSMAAVEDKSIGEIVSALLRKALQPPDYKEMDLDLPSFRISENASPLTLELVREAEEDIE